MAKKKTPKMPIPVPALIQRMQSSGMMRAGGERPQLSAILAARMQKPTGKKRRK